MAATNRNLEERVREGRFRQDLYFRLKVVKLRMPSLAECRGDILIARPEVSAGRPHHPKSLLTVGNHEDPAKWEYGSKFADRVSFAQ